MLLLVVKIVSFFANDFLGCCEVEARWRRKERQIVGLWEGLRDTRYVKMGVE